MIAALPMYDWPELHQAHDILWEKLRDQFIADGIEAPRILSRNTGDGSYWLSPDLILGQTCGYPYATLLKGKVSYLTTPVYDVAGCRGAYYSSAIIAHTDSSLKPGDLRGQNLAFNSIGSWSGYRTMMLEYGKLESYFGKMTESGGHRQSARIVAERKADVAAVDAVCWHFLKLYEPDTTKNLEVIGWTRLQPALPFITSLGTPPQTIERMRTAIQTALTEFYSSETGRLLALKSCEVLDPEIYMAMGEVK